MNYQSRRVPVALGPLAQKIYLTLVAEADPEGVVANSSRQNLMDFAEAKRRDVDRCVILLEQHKLLRVVDTTEIKTRSTWFELLGAFREDMALAKRFYDDNHPRVRNQRNARARRVSPINDVASKKTEFSIVIETIKEMEVEQKDPKREPNFRQWRITLRIVGFATIKNCFARTFETREPFVAGPTTRIETHWMDLVEFEPATLVELRKLVLAAVHSHDTGRLPSLHREDATLQMKA